MEERKLYKEEEIREIENALWKSGFCEDEEKFTHEEIKKMKKRLDELEARSKQ